MIYVYPNVKSIVVSMKAASNPGIGLLEKKYVASRMACLFFLLFNIFWFFDTVNQPVINLISIAGIIVFSTQFIFQFKLLNGVLGGLSIFLSVYFILTIIDEFSGFEAVTKDAYTLITVGLVLGAMGVLSSFLMLRSLIAKS